MKIKSTQVLIDFSDTKDVTMTVGKEAEEDWMRFVLWLAEIIKDTGTVRPMLTVIKGGREE